MFVLLPATSASAETTREWQVFGLPAAPNGIVLELSSDPNDASAKLLHKLENQGYPLAEVRVAGNRLVVVFGEITEVEVQGFEERIDALIHGYLDHLIGTSPTTDQVSHAMALINDTPGVSASMTMLRLDDLGHYKAVVSGERRWQGGVFTARNTPTRKLESREFALHQEFYSGLIAGDIIRFDLTAVDTNSGSEAYALQLSHEFPLDNDGTFMEARFSHFEANSENQFEPGQSIESETNSGALVIGHAFKRYVEVADYIYGEIDYRAEDNGNFGTSEYGVFRGAFTEVYHGDHGDTSSWSVSLSGGRELSDPDSTFGLVRGGFGLIFWVPELYDTAEMRIEASGQLGSVDTPGFELFSFGGVGRQRGFAAFEYAGNHGADLTIELAETFQPFAPSAPILTPYVFTDATYVANSSAVVSDFRPEHNELVSTGIGSKITFFNGLSFDTWLAAPVYDGVQPDRSRDVEFYLQGQFSW